MPNLFYAEQELQHARDSFDEFKKMRDYDFMNRGFYDFIIHLDLIFIKAEKGCLDIRRKFEPFQGYYKKLRREDPLLAYLKNARDAINHDVGLLYHLKIVSNKVVDHIDLTRIDKDGKENFERHSLYPAEIRLLKFHINNKDWEPPIMHLGVPLFCPDDPNEVAQRGILFYDNFLKEIKRKFIK